MKRRSISTALFLVLVPGCVAALFALSASELIVDFDRTRIDGGQNVDTGAQPPPDSSVEDVITPATDASDASDAAATRCSSRLMRFAVVSCRSSVVSCRRHTDNRPPITTHKP